MIDNEAPNALLSAARPLRSHTREKAAEVNSSDLRQYLGSAYGTRTRGLCLERAAC